jgi:hypothetical protein
MATPPIFPSLPGVKFPIKKTPGYKTIVQEAVSGREYRLNQRSNVYWTWNFDYDYLIDDANFTWATQNFCAQQLQGFFGQCEGQWGTFLYRDPYDYTTGTTPVAIGSGDGVQTVFPVYRSLYGLVEYLQYMDYIAVYLNGVLSPSGFAYTHFPSTLTFSLAPLNGTVISFIGSWYFLCRFTKDDLEFQHDGYGLWSLAGLEFKSLIS